MHAKEKFRTAKEVRKNLLIDSIMKDKRIVALARERVRSNHLKLMRGDY